MQSECSGPLLCLVTVWPPWLGSASSCSAQQPPHMQAKAKALPSHKEGGKNPQREARTFASSCVHVYTCKSATAQFSLSSQVCEDSVPSSILGATSRGSTALDLNSLCVLEEAGSTAWADQLITLLGEIKHLCHCPLWVFIIRRAICAGPSTTHHLCSKQHEQHFSLFSSSLGWKQLGCSCRCSEESQPQQGARGRKSPDLPGKKREGQGTWGQFNILRHSCCSKARKHYL